MVLLLLLSSQSQHSSNCKWQGHQTREKTLLLIQFGACVIVCVCEEHSWQFSNCKELQSIIRLDPFRHLIIWNTLNQLWDHTQQLHTEWTAHFSVGGRPLARIFGPARTEDCNSWSKMITIILICAWRILICVSLNPRCLADLMRRISSCALMPSDPNYITLPTDRLKYGAERVSFSVEGSGLLHENA